MTLADPVHICDYSVLNLPNVLRCDFTSAGSEGVVELVNQTHPDFHGLCGSTGGWNHRAGVSFWTLWPRTVRSSNTDYHTYIVCVCMALNQHLEQVKLGEV